MIQSAGHWIAACSQEEQQLALEEDPELKQEWHETHGDRKTDIVFIGIQMNRADLIRSLDECLLSEEEMVSDWSVMDDPLPEFI